MTPPDEAQQLIEEHIASLDEKKSQLERALAHLKGPAGREGEARPGREPGAGNRPQGQGGGPRTQAPRGARRKEVIADLKANPGSRPGEIAKRLGIAPTHAQTILSKLVEEERVTKSGPQYTWAGGA